MTQATAPDAGVVLEPPSIAELAAAVRRASQSGQSIAIRGSGTKSDWGGIAAICDVTVSTKRLNAVVEHRHGDLTATVQAGAALADVNRELAKYGQWIALDPAFGDLATIGGILATNDSGPRRHRFGAPRDQIIGVEIVRANGIVAKSGGIVVKNVAGYDLGRLMTGSFGSLGVIASATFKLYPLPPASRTLVVELSGDAPGRLAAAVSALTASQLTPTAIEIQTHPVRLLVRFESIEAAADQQAAAAGELVHAAGGRSTIVSAVEESALWQEHAQRPWRGTGAVLKVTLLPTEVAPTLVWLDAALGDIEWEAVGRAGAGVLLVRVDAETPRQAEIVASLRSRIAAGRGSVVVLRAMDELKRAVDVWGPPGDVLALMRAVKHQFDPEGRLNRGRAPFGV